MDIRELKQELLDKKLRPYYVFTGEELALQDIYINKIKEISGYEIIRPESVASIFSRLTANSLIKRTPVIFVIRNDDDWYKAESSWEKLKDKDMKGNILILTYSIGNKASAFCKYHDNILTEFDFIGNSLLKNRLQAITKMPDQYCEDIVKMCGNNYGRMKNEIYKLQKFAQVHNWSWNTAYLEAKACNLIHEDIGDIIFEFTGAIENRNIKKAYELWPKMKYTGDGPMRIISVLYNSFRQILMVQSTPENMRKEDILGMTKGQIYITAQKCNKYNIYEVVNIVKTLRYLEKGIKIGTVAEEFAIDYLMGTIW
jgi:DNA polymerase III delta subunit